MDVAKNYIEFKLGEESYAVKMESVREIIKPLKSTPLLGAPDFVRGVSKVRDHVITIIDLHHKFNINVLSNEEGEESPRILILEYGQDRLGFYVDDVVEIIATPSVEPVTNIIHHGICREIIKLETSLIPILDVDQLFAKDVAEWLNV